MTGVDFKLTPHGVVSGKITDEDGDPMEGVQVQIMRIAYNQGKKQLQMNGGEQTNDLGEYRMSGITPGKYYLAAIYRNRRPVMMMMPGTQESASPQEDYVTTYYPGSTTSPPPRLSRWGRAIRCRVSICGSPRCTRFTFPAGFPTIRRLLRTTPDEDR